MLSHNLYNKHLKSFARENRNESTKAEIKLWVELLKNKKMLGYAFRRQRPIGPYIADFFCIELSLVIEIDGYTHIFEETQEKDIKKEHFLKENGYALLRFSDNEVMKETDNVRRKIEAWILDWEEKRKVVFH